MRVKVLALLLTLSLIACGDAAEKRRIAMERESILPNTPTWAESIENCWAEHAAHNLDLNNCNNWLDLWFDVSMIDPKIFGRSSW